MRTDGLTRSLTGASNEFERACKAAVDINQLGTPFPQGGKYYIPNFTTVLSASLPLT
jgi:hypothetical protein